MRGHCILSHGFESGPDATKVTALAEAAERMGYTHERPDYSAFDAREGFGEHGDVAARIALLMARAQRALESGPLVLAGSSLGAWISGHVSLQLPVSGLFLMAPPIRPGSAFPLQAADVPISIIHGWDDELIPAQQVVDWAAPRKTRLLLVDDGHRLSGHVQASADAFAEFLGHLDRTAQDD